MTDSPTRPPVRQALDLSPAVPAAGARRPKRKKRLRNWLTIGVFTLALVAILFQALTSARVYFYNVDEAVRDREAIGSTTFRIQGTVVTEPQTDAQGVISFIIAFNDVETRVRHIGDEPTDLFELGMPVVAEGRWDGAEFESSQLLIKHSETYVEDNGDRPAVGDGTYEVEPE